MEKSFGALKLSCLSSVNMIMLLAILILTAVNVIFVQDGIASSVIWALVALLIGCIYFLNYRMKKALTTLENHIQFLDSHIADPGRIEMKECYELRGIEAKLNQMAFRLHREHLEKQILYDIAISFNFKQEDCKILLCKRIIYLVEGKR